MRRLALLLVAVSGVAASGADVPADYAVTARVVPSGGAPVQRLDLPAGILAALRRPDAADLRLFDRDGRVLPMAREEVAPRVVKRRPVAVRPILGGRAMPGGAGVSLTLDPDGGARVTGLGVGRDGPGDATVLGALLDARALVGTGTALALAVDTPTGQPVTLTVEASADLGTWRSVGTTVAFRSEGADERVLIPLDDLRLDRTWLRVTWSASSPLLAPVTVRSATVLQSSRNAGATPTIAATAPITDDRHVVEAALPFATPLTGLAVVPDEDAILPIRVLGRSDGEQPWRVVGQGTAARIAGGARPGMIAIEGAGVRIIRIEADPRTDGFAQAPALVLRLAPASIVFATGPAPITLAAGRVSSEDRFLPLSSVLAGRPAGVTLPTATLSLSDTPIELGRPDRLPTPGTWLLWGVLLLAVTALGLMARHLLRTKQPVGEGRGPE